MFWSSGTDLLRILVIGPLAYLALIVILRVTGKRMLSKMNAYDLVVTIALGSVLATVLLSKEVVLLEGIFALAVLIGLQYVIAWSSTRWPLMNRLIKSEPTLLYYRGEFLHKAMLRENVSEDSLRSRMRAAGFGSLDDVEAAVLEPDGSLSILSPSKSSENLLLDPRNRPGEAEVRSRWGL